LRTTFNRARAAATLPLLVVHRLGWTAPFQVVRKGWQYVRTARERLYTRPFASQTSSQPVLADAIRWLNPAAAPRGVQTALFAHPTSAVSWNLSLQPNARVAAWASLLPDVWNKNTGGVRFSLELETVDGRPIGSAHRDVYSGTRSADRRWRRLAVRANNRDAIDVKVTLRTTIPDGVNSAWAWAVWGDPQIEYDRAPAEMVRVLREQLHERGRLVLRQPQRAHADQAVRLHLSILERRKHSGGIRLRHDHAATALTAACHTRSRMAAAPMPVPTHMVTMPYLRLVRRRP